MHPMYCLFASPPAPQMDVFALGLILWEMVVRARPWYGTPMVVIPYLQCKEGQRPPLPAEGDPRCPQALRRLITRCWAQEPAARPSAAEVVKRLTLVLDSLGGGQGSRQGEGEGEVEERSLSSNSTDTCSSRSGGADEAGQGQQ